MGRSSTERRAIEVVMKYFKAAEGIELRGRGKKEPFDLKSFDGKIGVEVKGIVNDLWNVGRVSDAGYQFMKKSSQSGIRYELHIVRFHKDRH